MSQNNSPFLLYLITDSKSCTYLPLEEVVHKAVTGGVTAIQLRTKNETTSDTLALGKKIQTILAPYNIPLIINDKVDVALALDADGVHLGQEDMPYKDARKLLGPNKIIGLTVENKKQAQTAEALDVDYLGVGPVFPTQTKNNAPPALGLSKLSSIKKLSRHYICAIGGITSQNAEELFLNGADGVAIASAICNAKKPELICKKIVGTYERIRKNSNNRGI